MNKKTTLTLTIAISILSPITSRAETFTPVQLTERAIERRAIEAANWGRDEPRSAAGIARFAEQPAATCERLKL
jgi:hypothetical protein